MWTPRWQPRITTSESTLPPPSLPTCLTFQSLSHLGRLRTRSCEARSPDGGLFPLQHLPISTGPSWPVSTLSRAFYAATQMGDDWEPHSHPKDPLSRLCAGNSVTFIKSPGEGMAQQKQTPRGMGLGSEETVRPWGVPDLSPTALPAQRGSE